MSLHIQCLYGDEEGLADVRFTVKAPRTGEPGGSVGGYGEEGGGLYVGTCET